jgi:CYTH domain-containing protein
MTYKGTGGSNTALAHEEYNLPLTDEAYKTLAGKAGGVLLRKKRVLIPYGQYTIELDLFDEPYENLIIAEVEFASVEEADAFTPPDWFDEDVTGRKEYRNSYLAGAESGNGPKA